MLAAMRRTTAILILLSGLSLACETAQQQKVRARDKANEQRFLELEAQLDRHTSRIEKLTARIEQLEGARVGGAAPAPAAAP
jgi:hypothetical protein